MMPARSITAEKPKSQWGCLLVSGLSQMRTCSAQLRMSRGLAVVLAWSISTEKSKERVGAAL